MLRGVASTPATPKLPKLLTMGWIATSAFCHTWAASSYATHQEISFCLGMLWMLSLLWNSFGAPISLPIIIKSCGVFLIRNGLGEHYQCAKTQGHCSSFCDSGVPQTKVLLWELPRVKNEFPDVACCQGTTPSIPIHAPSRLMFSFPVNCTWYLFNGTRFHYN
jgi:hypothetical protein